MKKLLVLLLLSSSSWVMASEVSKVNVKKVDTDLYRVKGKDIYIKIRHCYKSAYNEEAILKIDSKRGYNIGKLIFDNGNTCNVEKILD